MKPEIELVRSKKLKAKIKKFGLKVEKLKKDGIWMKVAVVDKYKADEALLAKINEDALLKEHLAMGNTFDVSMGSDVYRIGLDDGRYVVDRLDNEKFTGLSALLKKAKSVGNSFGQDWTSLEDLAPNEYRWVLLRYDGKVMKGALRLLGDWRLDTTHGREVVRFDSRKGIEWKYCEEWSSFDEVFPMKGAYIEIKNSDGVCSNWVYSGGLGYSENKWRYIDKDECMMVGEWKTFFQMKPEKGQLIETRFSNGEYYKGYFDIDEFCFGVVDGNGDTIAVLSGHWEWKEVNTKNPFTSPPKPGSKVNVYYNDRLEDVGYYYPSDDDTEWDHKLVEGDGFELNRYKDSTMCVWEYAKETSWKFGEKQPDKGDVIKVGDVVGVYGSYNRASGHHNVSIGNGYWRVFEWNDVWSYSDAVLGAFGDIADNEWFNFNSPPTADPAFIEVRGANVNIKGYYKSASSSHICFDIYEDKECEIITSRFYSDNLEWRYL